MHLSSVTCLLRKGKLHFFGMCFCNVQERLCIQGGKNKNKTCCHWFCSALTVTAALALTINLQAELLWWNVSGSVFMTLQVVTGKWYKG